MTGLIKSLASAGDKVGSFAQGIGDAASGGGNPFANAEEGTLRNFINRIAGGNPTDVGPAQGAVSPAAVSGVTTSSPTETPITNTPARIPSAFEQESALPVKYIDQLRSSLAVGAGLSPLVFGSPDKPGNAAPRSKNLTDTMPESSVTNVTVEDIPPGEDPLVAMRKKKGIQNGQR